MTKSMARETRASRFARDRRGNFGMMTAIVLPIILATAGVAIDLTNMVMTKGELQDGTDAAALAAASALANDGKSVTEAKEIAMRFLKAQISKGSSVETDEESKDENDLNSATTINIKETVLNGSGKAFSVDVATNYTVQFNAFTRLLGQESTTLKAMSSAASATESKNALSMFLVLDRSGSMAFITNEKDPDPKKKCQNHASTNWYTENLKETSPCYISKIAALKTAVASLVTQLNLADPQNKFVRTGAVAYNDAMFSPVDLAWGTTGALAYVNTIPTVPLGGTDSSGGFAKALAKLKDTAEDTLHKNKNGQVPSRYIVFMTDGENTHYNGAVNNTKSDQETKKSCDEARVQKIEVYTVAFMAPERGQTLLKYCATSSSNYFEATNMAALVAAFKAIGDRTAASMSRLTK
jgi:Flp pilus assembly protein TadG